MKEYVKRDFYMKWLYRVAYKFYLLNPWSEHRYFDFMCRKYDYLGKENRYIINFENYGAINENGDQSPTKTIWLHLYDEKLDAHQNMDAFCCIFSSVDKIPENYLEEVRKWKKQPFSLELTPFFIDFTGEIPVSLSFETSKQMYYLMNHAYGLMISQKNPAHM